MRKKEAYILRVAAVVAAFDCITHERISRSDVNDIHGVIYRARKKGYHVEVNTPRGTVIHEPIRRKR